MTDVNGEPSVRVEFDDEQLVQRIRLAIGRTSELDLGLLESLVLVQVLGAEVTLLPLAPVAAAGEFSPMASRLATPAFTDRALRLADRVLAQNEAPHAVASGDRKDVLVTTTGARVSGLEINRAWASRVNPLDLAARMSLRLRDAQQAARRDASGDLDTEIAAFAAEMAAIMEGR